MSYSLATCSFTAFRPEMGVAVSTSVGYPRFFRHRPLEQCKLLAPVGIFKNPAYEDDPDKFRAAYLDRLESGRNDIAAALLDIGRRYGLPPVLLCYENLADPEKFCHRTWLARWLADTIGLDVPELGPHRGDA